MSLLLSGRVRNKTSSAGFLNLAEAQAALGNTPSTSTGYTLVAKDSYVSYSSSLGNINFTSSNSVSYLQSNILNGDVIYKPNGVGTLYLYGSVVIPELNATAKTKIIVQAATTASVSLIGGAPIIVDGVTLVEGDVVLVKAQSNPAQNGVYQVSSIGQGSNGTWLRTPDTETSSGLTGAIVFVSTGTQNGGFLYYTSFRDTQTIEVDPVDWYQIITDLRNQTLSSKTINNSPIGTVTSSTGRFTLATFNTVTVANSIIVGSTASVASNLTVGGPTRITDSTSATSTFTGALTIGGGLGVNGAVYARAVYVEGNPLNNPIWNGGDISSRFRVNNPEESYSTSSGAFTVLGGAGVGQSLFVGKKIVLETKNENDTLSFSIRNTATTGQSYTWSVGGNNSKGQNGLSFAEGSLILFHDTQAAYRLVINKSTGNLLVGSTFDTGDKLQVEGSIKFKNGQLYTGVTAINNTVQTVIDQFSASEYRTAKYLVQIADGTAGDANFHVVEIVVLIDNQFNVFKSEYGIITTGGEKGTFDADYDGVGGFVRLLFTASSASSKVIKVLRQSITRL